MTHKTRKISVVVATIVAVLCMVVAILGFISTGYKADASLANTATERIAEADAVDKTNVKSHMLYSTTSTRQLYTKEAPNQDATKIFLEYVPVFVSDTSGGSYFMQISDGTTAKTISSVFSGYFQSALAVSGSRSVMMLDLDTGEYSLDRLNGQYRSGTTTEDVKNTYNRLGFWVNQSAATASILFKDVKAYDDTGKDLGVVSSDNSFVEVDHIVSYKDGDTSLYATGVVSGATVYEYVPTKDNYLFVGWYTDTEYTTKYDFTQPVNADITLYAKWTSIEHIIGRNLRLNDSTALKGFVMENRLSVSDGATKVYIEYTISNDNMVDKMRSTAACVFNGAGVWDRLTIFDSSSEGNTYVASLNNKYFYTGSYTLIFDLVENKAIWYRGSVVVLEQTSDKNIESGLAFGIFSYADGVGSEVISNIKIYDNNGKDLGLKSRDMSACTIDFPQVTFNADNGSATSTVQVTGATVSAPTTPTKDGYKFLGWYNGNVLYDFSAEVVGDLTLVAKWAKVEKIYSHIGDDVKSIYTKEAPAEGATKVYFYYAPQTLYGTGSGGSLGISAYNGNTSSQFGSLPSEKLSTHLAMSGYTFLLEVDLNSKYARLYNPKTIFGDLVRTEATLEVDFNEYNQFGIWVNGVDNVSFTWQIHAYDDTGKDLGVEYVDGTWNKHDYTVSYVTNCDAVINPVGAEKGKATVAPAAIANEGMYFAGWYSDSEFNTAYDFNSAVSSDLTLYAKWVDFETYYAGLLSTGAPSIRVEETTTSGIRFATTVNTELLAELAQEGYAYTLGTLIVPFDYVGDVAPTMEWLDANGRGYYNLVSTYDGTKTAYYGTLKSLKVENYGRKWVGLGYVAIDMGDDTVKYIYAEYDANNAKSIYDVAETFYNNYKDDENEIENVEVAKFYIDSVVVLNAEYQVVEKVTGTELPYEVAINENVVTITVKSDVEFVIKSVVINGKIAKVVIAEDGKSATYQIA